MDKEAQYICTMEFYVATRKNEIMTFSGKQVQLEVIILNEISQTQKDKSYMVSSHMWNLDLN